MSIALYPIQSYYTLLKPIDCATKKPTEDYSSVGFRIYMSQATTLPMSDYKGRG